MGKQSYSEKLRDSRWQRKRLEVLNSAGFRCQSCGNTDEMLHVHHIYYEKDVDPWDYPDEVYMVLCDICHDRWHKIKAKMDKSLCHVDIDHLIHLQEIVNILSEMGPNVTLVYYDMIVGYQNMQLCKEQAALFGG